MTQLLAYRLAAEGRLKDVIPVGTPITAVSFASPQVGNNAYNEAFSRFEREGVLRHIRVSNAGDVVPVAPVFLRYTQTGLHLFLEEDEKEMEVGHRNLKRLSKETMHLMKWGDNHSTEEYWKRLAFEKNQVILERNTVEDLYVKYFPEGPI